MPETGLAPPAPDPRRSHTIRETEAERRPPDRRGPRPAAQRPGQWRIAADRPRPGASRRPGGGGGAAHLPSGAGASIGTGRSAAHRRNHRERHPHPVASTWCAGDSRSRHAVALTEGSASLQGISTSTSKGCAAVPRAGAVPDRDRTGGAGQRTGAPPRLVTCPARGAILAHLAVRALGSALSPVQLLQLADAAATLAGVAAVVAASSPTCAPVSARRPGPADRREGHAALRGPGVTLSANVYTAVTVGRRPRGCLAHHRPDPSTPPARRQLLLAWPIQPRGVLRTRFLRCRQIPAEPPLTGSAARLYQPPSRTGPGGGIGRRAGFRCP